MLEIEKKKLIFKRKEIWFSDYPFNVSGCQVVTFKECKNKTELKGFERKDFTTLVIDLTQDLDTIWKNMDNSSCRYSIKRAKREGIEIKINCNYEEFYEINRSFAKDKDLGTGDIPVRFFEKNGTLFTAEFNGEVIGGQFYLNDENNMRWLVGASKRLEVNKEMATLIGNANRLIIWEAINYAKNRGIKEFDMGGVYTGNAPDEQKERINKFKKSFGGELVTHYIYEKYYSGIYKFARRLYQSMLKS